MVETQIKETERAAPQAKAGYTHLVFRFLGMWLSFVLLLVPVAFLLNVDWARPKLEEMISETLHRQVSLGRLSWSFGLNGLAIAADRMKVQDPDGTPLLRSARSEIGLAFLPLLRGQLLIHHLAFKNPEVWAVRLSGDTWNFSDLLKPGPDIRFVQVDSGKIHLTDRSAVAPATSGDRAAEQPASSDRFNDYVFENVGMKFVWPRKDRRWPVYLSFSLPRPGYKTQVKLTALGHGLLEQWQGNRYKFELAAEKLNPDDLGPLKKLLPDLHGIFNLKLDGEGVFDKGLKARAQAQIENLRLLAPGMGTVTAAQASGTSNFYLGRDALRWDELVVKLAGMEIKSRGSLSQRPGMSPTYRAQVSGRVPNLNQLPFNAAVAASTARKGMTEFLDPARLTGSAEFELVLSGPESAMEGKIKADMLSAKDLLERQANGLPVLELLGIDPSTRLKGEIVISPQGRIELPEAWLDALGARVKASGYWDRSTEQSAVSFQGQKLSLAGMDKRLASSRGLAAYLKRHLNLPSLKLIHLGGHMDLAGHLSSAPGHQERSLALSLHSAELGLEDKSIWTSGINGRVRVNGCRIEFDNIAGNIDGGTFELNGSVDLLPHPHMDVRLTATRVDLEPIERALEVLRVRAPVLSERQLYGRVKNVALRITGSPESPSISLAAQPDDLYYEPPGLTRPLKAVSGSLTYEKDELVLKDVTLVSKGGKVTTNLAIGDLSGQARLKRLKVNTTGVELSEIHYYLSSPLMPPALKNSYNRFMSQHHIASVHGKAYGNLLWQPRGNDFDLDGVIGFYSAGCQLDNRCPPVAALSGIIAASGDELLLQDLSGRLGQTTFVLDGHVTGYRSQNPVLEARIRSQLMPAELLERIPGLAEQMGARVTSSGPLTVRATVSGRSNGFDVIFSARADDKDKLKIEGPFGSIHQPGGQAVSIDGSLSLAPGETGSIVVRNTNLLVGNSILQGKGSYSWAPGQEPELKVSISAPNPVPASTLVAVLDPGAAVSGVGGTVGGQVSAEGRVSNLRLAGKVDFQAVSLPHYNIHDATGRLESTDLLLVGGQAAAAGQNASAARLFLESARTGDVQVRNVAAELALEPRTARRSTPRAALRSLTAEIAGGNVSMDGWFDLSNHKMYMDATLSKVDAALISSGLLSAGGELSGSADARIVLESQGLDYKEMLRNLDGRGEVTISSGKVARFGKLQERITQANLLHQGLFGFNLNNLLQSVVPVRTGEFNSLTAAFDISNGLLSIQELKFSGDDMRLRAAGVVNLPLNTIELDVAGNIPRVSSSLLGGPVGQVSREITLQKFLHVVTLKKLENLPSVPLLGDIASDRPRAFSFHVATKLDRPDLIAQSIEKTFHWLPNQPNATAHPVPGIK